MEIDYNNNVMDLDEEKASAQESGAELNSKPSDDTQVTAENAEGLPAQKSRAERFFTKPWALALCAIFCCLLWGSAFPCVKIGYKLFEINTDSAPS